MYVNGLSIGCNYLAVNGPVLRCVTRNLFNWFTKKCMCTVLKLKKKCITVYSERDKITCLHSRFEKDLLWWSFVIVNE